MSFEVNRQQCQECGSRELKNILVREHGAPARVYVRCNGCTKLVAFYELSRYYHHGKGLESYMRSVGELHGDSAREFLKDFKEIQGEALEGYEEALEHLEAEGKEI